MAEQRPNPIPIYISFDASLGMANYGSGYISANQTDLDGGDATECYRVSDISITTRLTLLRKIKIYSRGTNGAGKAFLWVDDGGGGGKECIGMIQWDSIDRGLVRLGGEIQYFNVENEDPAEERMRGYLMRVDTRLFVQIEDGSISDGYRVHTEVRNLTKIEGLNDIN